MPAEGAGLKRGPLGLALAALFIAGCTAPKTVTACQLVRDPATYLERVIAIEDVALPTPGGTVAITAVRGCPVEAIQGIELELGAAGRASADLLRRNLEEGRRRSRPNNVLGVAARFVGEVKPGVDGALILHVRRIERQEVRRADDMLQPGLFNTMQAEPDTIDPSNALH